MALKDAVAGAPRNGQLITWLLEDNEVPESLAGATLTGTLTALPSYTTRAIAGVLTVVDGPAGIFSWAYHVNDLVAGQYLVQFTATYGAPPSPAISFETSWTVHPRRVVPVP